MFDVSVSLYFQFSFSQMREPLKFPGLGCVRQQLDGVISKFFDPNDSSVSLR
jgi:hypothetical protein